MLLYLIRRFRWLVATAALTSIASGVCGVLLVTEINAAITASREGALQLPWRLGAVIAGAVVFGVCANVLFERLRQRAIADLRLRLCERVMDAPLRRLEELGPGQVQSALSDHAASVAQFFISLPNMLTHGVVVLGCMAYMASLSWRVFVVGAGVVALGSLGYSLAQRVAMRHLTQASRAQDRLFDHFRSLTDGAKELRQNRRKRGEFSAQLLDQAVEDVRRHRATGLSIFRVAIGWGNLLIYTFIGAVIFVLAGDGPDRAHVMTGFALVFVYMVTPLQSLLNALPEVNLARVASRRIDAIADRLASAERVDGAAPFPLRPSSVSLRAVTRGYVHERSGEAFTLGPIDLKLSTGEVVFVVGGNGSGKTTLAKLLVGLYPPESGEVLVDGRPVSDLDRDAYRQLFSTVFSDFHLFERLLESGRPDDVDETGSALLAKLHLQHKVRLEGGAFSTRELSQGQRKRLALVVAYLEDRPFLVFDEWAADQDPVFKRVFYQELLPELRALGKAVIVISHDDRFFHVADRVIRLEEGRIRSQDVSPYRAVRRAAGQVQVP
ncbi:cyclic peptide export ABC transporter [Roseateles sp.]|uniref:cyclic peptide export ABC transporter n=1 Tax=Roseateles sp. TaxID=1971397 RepID=UPI0039EA8174